MESLRVGTSIKEGEEVAPAGCMLGELSTCSGVSVAFVYAQSAACQVRAPLISHHTFSDSGRR